MNIDKLFPSKYVKADDLGAKTPTLTIRSVVMEKMGNPPEEKAVVHFDKATKGLVLNRTNGMIIAGLYGKETEDWIGKRVTLYATQVKAFGKVQAVIRVKDQRPAPAAAPAGNGHPVAPAEEAEALTDDVDLVDVHEDEEGEGSDLWA